MVMSKRPPLDEWLSLFEATIAAEGITTLAGAAAGNSIIDGGLAGVGANSFVSMLMVVYPGQPRLVDSMDITAFSNGTGEVTFSTAYKGVAAAIPAGVPYKIVTFRFVPAEVAAIEAKLDHATHGLAALRALLDIIAGYLDTEIAAILAGITITPVASTYPLPSGLAEQTAFTITPGTSKKIKTIYLDFTTLTQNCTIRVRVTIDAVNAKTIETMNWTTGMDDGVFFREITSDVPVLVTIQSLVAEGASRNIPYRYYVEG